MYWQVTKSRILIKLVLFFCQYTTISPKIYQYPTFFAPIYMILQSICDHFTISHHQYTTDNKESYIVDSNIRHNKYVYILVCPIYESHILLIPIHNISIVITYWKVQYMKPIYNW